MTKRPPSKASYSSKETLCVLQKFEIELYKIFNLKNNKGWPILEPSIYSIVKTCDFLRQRKTLAAVEMGIIFS